MYYLLLALLFVVLFGLLSGWIYNKRQEHRLRLAKGDLSVLEEPVKVDTECCGQHEMCEKDSLLAAVSRTIEYYDDEELDRFAGKEDDTYSEEESEEFRDILYSMQEEEVAGWCRSLQLRGVPLPQSLKEEVFLILGERRIGTKPHSH